MWLEYDEDRLDRYQRTLAYVWLDDKTMLNERLLAEGLATAEPVAPDLRYQERFAQTSLSAREAGLGMWALTEHKAEPTPFRSSEPRTGTIEPNEPEPSENEEVLGWLAAALLVIAGVGVTCLLALRNTSAPSGKEEPYL